MMSKIAKELEWKIRSLRQLLSVRYHKEYRTSKAVFSKFSPSGKPLAYLDLSHIKLDRDGGRFAYSVIKDVLASGYQVVMADRFGFFCSFQKRKLKQLLWQEDITILPAGEIPASASMVLSDRRKTLAKVKETLSSAKTVLIDYTYRKAQGAELSFPFFPHPALISRSMFSQPLSDTGPRPIKVAFIGAYHRPDYDKEVLNEQFGMMSRHETISHLRRFYYENQIRIATDAMFASPLEPTEVIINEEYERIKVDHYTSLLRQSCFFLACAGVSYPVSHNLPEAMLSGCIPILQYASHLSPALEDGENCLTFHDSQSMEEAIRRAVNMPESEVQKMQEKVKEYAEQHCQIGSFTKQIIASSKYHHRVLLYSVTQPERKL